MDDVIESCFNHADDGGPIETDALAAHLGTAATGVTAVENGNGFHHSTVLTLAITLPAIVGGTNLRVGTLIYTFPAGVIMVRGAYMSLGITQSESNIAADTPDGGLGTVIATGAAVTLTSTFEDLLTGQTFNNCTGTVEVMALAPTGGSPFVILTGAAHTVHFNVADGWAANGDDAATVAGTVVLDWDWMV